MCETYVGLMADVLLMNGVYIGKECHLPRFYKLGKEATDMCSTRGLHFLWRCITSCVLDSYYRWHHISLSWY